jgi:hypothetical protein
MAERAALLIATTDADRRPDVPTFRSPQSVWDRRVKERASQPRCHLTGGLCGTVQVIADGFIQTGQRIRHKARRPQKKSGIRPGRIPPKYLEVTDEVDQ